MFKKRNYIYWPKEKAMEITGDKMKCKAVMKKADIPFVPGSDGIVNDMEEAVDIAAAAGYPVTIKISLWRRRSRN